jgi:hypothetical protein
MHPDRFKLAPVEAVRPAEQLHELQGVQVPELKTAELTQAQQDTDRLALAALDRMELPHPADSMGKRHVFPNPVADALQLTGAYETLAIQKMGKVKDELAALNNQISLCADFSQELALLPAGKDKYDLSDKAKTLGAQLREKGLNVFKEGTTSITREELTRMKSVIDTGVSQARTQMQKKHTDIQTQVQFLMSILETMKKMLATHERLMGKISQNTGVR